MKLPVVGAGRREVVEVYLRNAIRQHTSAYDSIRQHSIRQHSMRQQRGSRRGLPPQCHPSAYVSIRQHTSSYVSIAYVSSGEVVEVYLRNAIRQHTSACVRRRLTYADVSRLTYADHAAGVSAYLRT